MLDAINNFVVMTQVLAAGGVAPLSDPGHSDRDSNEIAKPTSYRTSSRKMNGILDVPNSSQTILDKPYFKGIEGKWHVVEGQKLSPLAGPRYIKTIELNDNFRISRVETVTPGNPNEVAQEAFAIGRRVALFQIPELCFEFPVTLWGKWILQIENQPDNPIFLSRQDSSFFPITNSNPQQATPVLNGTGDQLRRSRFDLEWKGIIPKLDAESVRKNVSVEEIACFGMVGSTKTVASVEYEEKGLRKELRLLVSLNEGEEQIWLRYPKDGPNVFCYPGQKISIMQINTEDPSVSHLNGRFIFVTADHPDRPILIEKDLATYNKHLFVASNDQNLLPENLHFTPGYQPIDWKGVPENEKEVQTTYNGLPATRVILSGWTGWSYKTIQHFSNGLSVHIDEILEKGERFLILHYPKGHPYEGRTGFVKADSNQMPRFLNNSSLWFELGDFAPLSYSKEMIDSLEKKK